MADSAPPATRSVFLRQLSSVRDSVGPARQKVVDNVLQHAEEGVKVLLTP